MVLTRLPVRLTRWLIVTALLAALMLAVAGRADLVMLNAYLVMLAAVTLAVTLAVDPDRIADRLKASQKGEDERRLLAIRLLTLATFTTALLDIGRLHFSDHVPRALQLAALPVAAASFLWVVWALAVNRFFVPVIRLQAERGHQVVDAGPYAWMRHPGYAGMVIALPASALALGSWGALAPAVAASILFVRRAAHEDRFLRGQLDGYDRYAARVRHRLVPGIWVVP